LAHPRISFVGAGSAVFSMEVIRDLCLTEELSGCKLVMMDVDKTRLEAVYDLARRYASEVHSDIQIESTSDLKTALTDTDFVIDTALAGGHYQQEAVRSVGEKHGYYRGLEAVEWNMVADYSTTFQGYSQLKLFLDLAQAVEEICPNALLIDVANPECEAGTLLTRKTKIKVVGYCHGYLHHKDIVEKLGLDLKEVDYQVAGFNHNIWLTKFKYRDAYPLLDEWIKNSSTSYWRYEVPPKNEFDVHMSRAAVDMYRLYGLFPVGDTTRSGSWKYHYDLDTKKYWYGPYGGPDSEIGYARYLDRLKEQTDKVLSLVNRPSDSLLGEFPPEEKGKEDIVRLISAVANDSPSKFVLDIRNNGVIPSMPDDVAVEVPVTVDGRGVYPERIDPIPRKLVDMALTPRLMRLNFAMEAFLSGDRSILLELLYRDVRTKSDKQAEQVLEEVLNLPFNEEMRRHYE
jgi:alpha-galactosidase